MGWRGAGGGEIPRANHLYAGFAFILTPFAPRLDVFLLRLKTIRLPLASTRGVGGGAGWGGGGGSSLVNTVISRGGIGACNERGGE